MSLPGAGVYGCAGAWASTPSACCPTPPRQPSCLDDEQPLAVIQPSIWTAAQQVLLGPVPGVEGAGLPPAVADERHAAGARAAAAGRRRPRRGGISVWRLRHAARQARQAEELL